MSDPLAHADLARHWTVADVARLVVMTAMIAGVIWILVDGKYAIDEEPAHAD